MNIEKIKGEVLFSYSDKRRIFVGTVITGIFISVMVSLVHFSDLQFIALAAMPLLILCALGFDAIFLVLVISMHLPIYILDLHVSIYILYFLFANLLLLRGKLNVDKFPLKLSFVFYLITILPSIFNSINIWKTLFVSQNILAIFIIAIILYNYIDSYAKIKKIFLFVVAISSFNAFYAIMMGVITGRRFWGFAGLEHVDYLSIIATLFVIIAILSKNIKKYLPLIFAIFFMTAMVITQTRNIFISFSVTLFLFVIYITIKNKKYGYNRVKLLFSIIFLILVVGTFIYTTNVLSSNQFKRFGQIEKMESQKLTSQEDFSDNSFFTRLLVWHTAYKAFSAHPFIGIGAYSFPFSSQVYEQLPDALYKEYVEGLAPHLSFFAVLSETGILGFTGFIFLLGSLIKLIYRNLSNASSTTEIFYTTVISFAQIYILFSLFVTDAWLRGQCGLLWGTTMGCLAGCYKLISSKTIYLSPEI
jgi:O-antigen ligase